MQLDVQLESKNNKFSNCKREVSTMLDNPTMKEINQVDKAYIIQMIRGLSI